MDWLVEYTNVVNPMLAIFEEKVEADYYRYLRLHQIGLINTAVSLQQFVIMGQHIEKVEGSISVHRVAQIVAEILHLMADRMVYMAVMDNDILDVVSEAMYPVVAKVIETMGIDYYGE